MKHQSLDISSEPEEILRKKLEDALTVKQEKEAQLDQAKARIAQLEELVSSGENEGAKNPLGKFIIL